MLAAVTGLLPVLLVNVPDGRARAGASFEGGDTSVRAGQGGHLGVENTIGDLLRHPAFAGFAHLILPWDDRAWEEADELETARRVRVGERRHPGVDGCRRGRTATEGAALPQTH